MDTTKYEADIWVPVNVLQKINGYLNACSDEEYQGEDCTIIYSVKFPDGKEMDIKCCGCTDDSSWVEAVLFDERGAELCCTEPEYTFLGPWELEYEGTLYSATVKPEKVVSKFVF